MVIFLLKVGLLKTSTKFLHTIKYLVDPVYKSLDLNLAFLKDRIHLFLLLLVSDRIDNPALQNRYWYCTVLYCTDLYGALVEVVHLLAVHAHRALKKHCSLHNDSEVLTDKYV